MRRLKALFSQVKCMLKFGSLNSIELKRRGIVGSESDNGTKQQELCNLMKELGLPTISSDRNRTILSYPDCNDKICDWLKDRRSEKYTKINVFTACMSTLMAVVAVVVSINIHYQTRQMLIPSERPYISTVDSKCKGNIDNAGELTITLNTIIKNVGKHPAENLKVRVWGAPLNNPNTLKKGHEFSLADTLFPDIPVTLGNSITMPSGKFSKLKDQQTKFFLYIRMDYEDKFVANTKYTTDFHMIYTIGKAFMSGATLKQKKAFESNLERAGAI